MIKTTRKFKCKIRKRLKNHATKKTTNESGYTQLYKKHVLQAPQGCDFDFLRPEIKWCKIFVSDTTLTV